MKIRARFLASMKMAAAFTQAIFMQGGEPKDHEVFGPSDILFEGRIKT